LAGVSASIAPKDARLTDEAHMRKTLLGMAAAATFVFSMGARANDVDRGADASGARDEGRGTTAMVQQERAYPAHDEERGGAGAEAVKPRDASMGAGSASGEPSAPAKLSFNSDEFLRNVWTVP
jgi:hypothetical protein